MHVKLHCTNAYRHMFIQSNTHTQTRACARTHTHFTYYAKYASIHKKIQMIWSNLGGTSGPIKASPEASPSKELRNQIVLSTSPQQSTQNVEKSQVNRSLGIYEGKKGRGGGGLIFRGKTQEVLTTSKMASWKQDVIKVFYFTHTLFLSPSFWFPLTVSLSAHE